MPLLLRFLFVRCVAAVGLLLVTSFVVFSLLHLAPGDPESTLLGGRPATPQLLEQIREQHHLDEPFLTQYGRWLSGAVRGDFGESIHYRSTVTSVLSPRIGPTIQLGLLAALIVFVLGIPVGVLSAVRAGSWIDLSASSATLLLASISSYVAGIVLLLVFGVSLEWFPVVGTGSGFGDRLYHLALPAIALALGLIALVARTMRASMLRVLQAEFIETVRARGFTERRVLLKHALRAALIPVLTVSGLVVGYLISGTVLIEYTFGLNGLGALLVEAVQAKDFAVVQAITLLFTAVFICLSLVVDILYGIADPRVRGLGQAG